MTATHVLSCREIVELVTDYLEGDLDAETTAALEVHLDLCPGCARYVEQIRETITTLGAVGSDNLPTEIQAGLLDAFKAFRRPAPPDSPMTKADENTDRDGSTSADREPVQPPTASPAQIPTRHPPLG